MLPKRMLINYKISFWAGPLDGAILYQWERPDDIYVIENHQYEIHWLTENIAQYIYKGETESDVLDI